MRQYISTLMRDERHTVRDVVPKFLLWLLSLLYGLVMRLRNLFYDRGILKTHDVGVPVISIGNITMGGAGKTPLVIFVVEQLVAEGFKPVVLLRGYMQGERSGTTSDEAEVIRRKLPGVDVITGADRVSRAREYLREQQCDVFVLDDAFQHRRIKRQLDIVVIDSTDPFGNSQVIPRGILREPLSGLRRADICVLTRTVLQPQRTGMALESLGHWLPKTEAIRTIHQPQSLVNVVTGERMPLDHLGQRSVVAFCGLGNPQGFHGTLTSIGMDIGAFVAFPDHHPYSAADVAGLIDKARENGSEVLVTTLKDAVKLTAIDSILNEVPFYYLDIGIEVTYGKKQFIHRIVSLLRG